MLGSEAGYVKSGMDPQEQALKDGVTPGAPGWGEDDPANYGRLGSDETYESVPTEHGDYGQFYKQMTDALTNGVPVPVNPADSLPVLAIIEQIRRESSLS